MVSLPLPKPVSCVGQWLGPRGLLWGGWEVEEHPGSSIMSANREELKKTNPVKEESHQACGGLCELLPDEGRTEEILETTL